MALSRDLPEHPRPADERPNEPDTAVDSLAEGSGDSSLSEPLLPSGAAGGGEPVVPWRGRSGTVPGFSVANVSLEVRRGEVSEAGEGRRGEGRGGARRLLSARRA